MIFPFKRVLIWVFHLGVLLDFYIHYICIFPISIFGCRILKGTSSFNHSWPKCFCTKAAQQVFIVTPWTGAHQAPLYIRFFRQKYWSGLPCPPLCELKYIPRPCNYSVVSGGWYRMIPTNVVAGPSPPTRAPSQGTEFSGRKGKHSKTRAWTPQFSIKKKMDWWDCMLPLYITQLRNQAKPVKPLIQTLAQATQDRNWGEQKTGDVRDFPGCLGLGFCAPNTGRLGHPWSGN